MSEKILKEILLFKHKENSLKDTIFNSALRKNFENFLKFNQECSEISFEFILFCILNSKIKSNILHNNNFVFINEEYLNSEYSKNDNEKFINKIIIIPYFSQNENKFGLILIKNLFKNEENDINIFIISPSEINESLFIFSEEIILKMNQDIKKKEIKEKIKIINLNNELNSSKILLNFINELLENDNLSVFMSNNLEKKINDEKSYSDNNLFEKIDKEYNLLLNDYLYYKKDNKIKKEENKLNNNNNEKTEKNIKNNNDMLDKIAKNITKNIMNLNFNNLSHHSDKNLKKIKKEKNQLIQKKKINLEKYCNKNNEKKQLDETTKNTINDILDYVLKEMKSKKRKIRRQFSQRNKRALINEQKQIEIIEEEDKESSTSELCKEKIIKEIRDSISSIKDNLACKEDLRESIDLNNKNNKNIINENKNENDIDNIKKKEEIIIKEKRLIKNEIIINPKENIINMNINDKKIELKENTITDNLDKNSSLTISNNNSIIENNSLDIENHDLEYSKPDIKRTTSPKDNQKNKRKRSDNNNINNKNNNKNNNKEINITKKKNTIIINNKIKAGQKKQEIPKTPKDAKFPKDNENKNKIININKNKNVNNSKYNSDKYINNHFLIKEAFSNQNKSELKYNNEKSLNNAGHYKFIINNKKEDNYIKDFNNNNYTNISNKNNINNNIILINLGNEPNKLIENLMNRNDKQKTEKSGPNNSKKINTNKKLIKSKTQDFQKSKNDNSENKSLFDKTDEFFTLNTDCIIS